MLVFRSYELLKADEGCHYPVCGIVLDGSGGAERMLAQIRALYLSIQVIRHDPE